MTDETHHKVSEDNPSRLLKIVIGLAVTYVMTEVDPQNSDRWLRESPAPKIGRKQGAGHEGNT